MLYFNLRNENSDAGHIKRSRRPQVRHPWFKSFEHISGFCIAVVRSLNLFSSVTTRIYLFLTPTDEKNQVLEYIGMCSEPIVSDNIIMVNTSV